MVREVAVCDGGFNTFDDGVNQFFGAEALNFKDLFLHEFSVSNQDGVVMGISVSLMCTSLAFGVTNGRILTKTLRYWPLLDSCSSARAARIRACSPSMTS